MGFPQFWNNNEMTVIIALIETLWLCQVCCSSWGQFLDHREEVRPALREQFLANLAALDMQRLWTAFPLPTYSAQAPMQAFYAWYDVEAQPQ